MFVLLIIAALIMTLPITGHTLYKKENAPGIVLCLILATGAWFLGSVLPLGGAPVLGILLGIIIANIKLPAAFVKTTSPGIKITSKKVLQTAIVLFGFQMNLLAVPLLGLQSVMLILLVVFIALTVSTVFGRIIGLRGTEQHLIGIGTAICGGSAIAAAGPILKASDVVLARSISVIFLYNIFAVFMFPLIGHLLNMSDLHFGMWAGAAINDTSSVVAASFSYSTASGEAATIVKLARTLLIVPICVILSIIQTRKEKDIKVKTKVINIFPWFVVGFVIAGLISTLGFISTAFTDFWGMMGRYLIVVAMSAIGLSCNFRDFNAKETKPFLLGGCCALAVSLAALVVVLFL